MKAKISKAQLEVWEWKEKAYQEMKHLSTLEQMNLIHEQTKVLADNIKKRSNGQNKKLVR